MVKVYAPASIGNIGIGFDLLGVAIASIGNDLFGDYISIKDSNTFHLEFTGNFVDQLPNELEKNIVFQCWQKFCEILGKIYPMTICLEKNIPIASGLGSSACSIVATFVAMNHYCGCPLNRNKLLKLMGEIEGNISGTIHFDNVSPCFLGGMQLILQECNIISQTVPVFDNWIWIIAYPGVEISTEVARSILPRKYIRSDCINYGRCLSGFIHACHTQQESLAIKFMQQDIIAEPYRSQLLPMQLCDIRCFLTQEGAISCGISGSGPTIFALCNTQETVDSVSYWLLHHYLQNDMGFIKVCGLDNFGARIISE